MNYVELNSPELR